LSPEADVETQTLVAALGAAEQAESPGKIVSPVVGASAPVARPERQAPIDIALQDGYRPRDPLRQGRSKVWFRVS